MDEKLNNIIATAHKELMMTLDTHANNLENENKGQNIENKEVGSIKMKEKSYQKFLVSTPSNNPTEVNMVSNCNGECCFTPC